jgi:hypothetical protein
MRSCSTWRRGITARPGVGAGNGPECDISQITPQTGSGDFILTFGPAAYSPRCEVLAHPRGPPLRNTRASRPDMPRDFEIRCDPSRLRQRALSVRRIQKGGLGGVGQTAEKEQFFPTFKKIEEYVVWVRPTVRAFSAVHHQSANLSPYSSGRAGRETSGRSQGPPTRPLGKPQALAN